MITLKISNVELTLTNKFLWFIASVREVAVSYTSSTEGTLGRVCKIVVSFKSFKCFFYLVKRESRGFRINFFSNHGSL